MKPVYSLLARLIGSPEPAVAPPAAEAETTKVTEDRPGPAPVRPAPTPALLARRPVAKPPATVEGESPAVTALRLEVQQLRLLRTPAGARELAARLSRSESDRAALDQRVLDLQATNESLTALVREAALENERLTDELAARR